MKEVLYKKVKVSGGDGKEKFVMMAIDDGNEAFELANSRFGFNLLT